MLKKLLVAVACVAPVLLSDNTRISAQSAFLDHLVISQVYGGGGNSGATLRNDFIEIFNASDSPVSLAGWSVQYASTTGSTWQVTPLSGSIAPGQYYLVQEAQGAGGTVSLPTPDATGTIAMAAGAGKVALVNTTTLLTGTCPAGPGISDFVGYGTGTNCFETAVTATLSNTTAALRASAGCTDTNNNSADFTTAAPAPRNTASPLHPCGGPPPIDQGPSVISQVYGGGGNSGADFTNDFIEIFNPGPTAVSLAGWSVQYASANGSTWQVTPLAGIVPPGRYHLVQESAGGGGTTPLPLPDSTGTIPMSATAGKIALVRSTTALAGTCPTGGDIADFVGYGGDPMDVSCFEGAGPAPALGANTSAVRARAGCTDTDQNASDFATRTPPAPHNIASPLNDCAAPPVQWPHDIQGSGNTSPQAGQIVAVRGIVTAKRFNNGFFIQTPDTTAALEGDPNTSEGIFVFTSAPTVTVGDDVVVTGTVSEFSPAADPHQPPITEIVSPSVSLQAAGQPLPAAVTLTASSLDPAGGPLQLEKYEGMRVATGTLTVVAPTSGNLNESNATSTSNGVFYAVFPGVARPFREAGIDVIDPPPPCDENAAGLCAIPVFDGNPERLRVDSDGQVGVPVGGASVATGATVSIVSGVLDYGFRTWTVLPDPGALTVVSDPLTPQAVPAPGAAEFQVASFNLERFFDTVNDPGIGEPVLNATAYANRLAKASNIIRNSLRMPDILGVQEAENLTVLQDLAARIEADAGPAGQPAPGYTAHLIEGNDIGGIDVGILTRSNVTVHSVEQWRPDEIYINPLSGMPETLNDRPSLILDATVQGPSNRLPAHVFVVVNHLRSLNGIDDAVDGRRVRAKRKAQGESVAQLLIDLQAAHPDVPVISVGDYNAFDVSDGYVDVLGIIRGDQAPAEQVVDWSALGLDANMVSAAPAGDYSYSFDGNAQTLDHVLLSSAAASALSGFSHAHIDADFPEIRRNDPATPTRLSDHDPAVARFTFPLDTIAPVFSAVSDITTPATTFDGATVVYVSPTATDNLDPSIAVTCAPASGSFFAVGSTTVTCTASDSAGNPATTSFVVTVTRADDMGSMLGVGQITGTSRVTFTFFARQAPTGAERGWLTLAASRPRGLPNTLVAIGLDDVLFLGTAVRFSGSGWWNGQAGHTFVVESADNGEPGAGLDTFAVTVRNPSGVVVLQAIGVLSAGNVDKLQ